MTAEGAASESAGEDEARDRTLMLFKRRADDILTCELAQRDDVLNLGKQFTVNVEQRLSTGRTRMVDFHRVVPPKEQVAYALALIRPLTLASDRIASKKILDALRANCPADDALNGERIATLRSAWAGYPSPRMNITQAPIDPVSDGPRVDVWDNEIARKYLYGDLVHGDDNAELLDALGEPTVLFAASAMASDGFMLVNNTYEVMHCLRSDIAPDHAHISKRFHEQESEPRDA